MNSRFLKLTFISVALCFLGCSETHSGVRGFGDSVLSTVGYSPPRDKFDANEELPESAVTVSGEQEYYLGRAVAAEILSRYDLYTNNRLTVYLNQVLQAVVAASDLPNTFGGYHVAVLDTEEINAVSAPGGLIFITLGMLRKITDEETLAAVLAHEVTHVSHHHGVQSISKDTVLKALMGLRIPASAISCNEVFLQGAAVFSAIVQEMVTNLLDKGYDRDMEFDADKGATKILRRAGFKSGAIGVILTALNEAQIFAGGWFSTHPSPTDRIAEVNRQLEDGTLDTFFARGLESRTKRFHAVMATIGKPATPT